MHGHAFLQFAANYMSASYLWTCIFIIILIPTFALNVEKGLLLAIVAVIQF